MDASTKACLLYALYEHIALRNCTFSLKGLSGYWFCSARADYNIYATVWTESAAQHQ